MCIHLRLVVTCIAPLRSNPSLGQLCSHLCTRSYGHTVNGTGSHLRLNTTLLHGQPDFQFPASIHHMATERLTPAKGREGVVQEEKASSFSSGVCCPHFVGSSSNSESSSPVLPTQGIYQRHLLAQAVHCMAAASLDCFFTSP